MVSTFRNMPGGWIVAAAAAAAAIFACEPFTPVGYTVAMLYVLPILLTWFLPDWRTTVWTGGGTVVLTWVGVIISPGPLTPESLANRAIVSLLLVLVAGLLAKEKQTAQQVATTREALREREEEFRAAFSISSVGMGQADPLTGNLLRVNRRFCEMTGYEEAELVNRPFSAITHPDDRTANLEGYGRLIRGDASEFRGTKRYLRKDGRVIWADVTANLVRDRDGRPLRTVAVIQDVTDWKRAEEALRKLNEELEQRVAQRAAEALQANERFEWVAKATHDGVWDWDLRHDTVYYSPQWKTMHGFENGEVLESLAEWSKRVHPDDRERVLGALQACATNQRREFWAEYRIQRKDGAYIWVLDRGIVLPDDGGYAVRMVGTEKDITWRKEAEQALREREAQLADLSAKLLDAQEVERARIAREIHDDFTQRLAALTLELRSLCRRLPEPGDSIASRVAALGDDAERLTTELQHLAHLLHPSILDHAGLEAAVREHAEEFAARTGLEAEVVARDVPKTVPVPQATCLYRVLQEGLQNVRKHADATTVLIRLLGTAHGLGLCVHDDGRGFSDAQPSVRRKGLGLTSMEERVRLVNGTFRVRTKPGDGTELHAWVPLDGGQGEA